MSKQKFENARGTFKDLLGEKNNVPIQKVQPIKNTSKKKEVHLNFWIPEDLASLIKIECVKRKTSMKQFAIEAFKNYINT